MTPAELKAARTRLGLSQTRLAALLGVEQSTVWRWESGENHVPAPVAAFMRHLLDEHGPA